MEHPDVKPPSRTERFRVLVADDDRMLVTLLRNVLRKQGYEVETCLNGDEALQRILDHKPHLAVLDFFMPGIDGRSLCERLQAMGSPTRRILLTSATQVQYRVAGLESGAHDYVCKPFDMEELVARIRAQLREVRVGDEAADAAAPPPTGLHFFALGDFQMRWRGEEVDAGIWKRRRPRNLLKYLLLHRGRVVTSDALMETFWPDAPLDRQRGSLHACVKELRAALRPFGGDRVRTVPGGYQLVLQPDDWLDLQEFERRLQGVTVDLAHDDAHEAAMQGVHRLLALYRGDLFSEDPYLEGVEADRERLHAALRELLARAAQADRRRGDLDHATVLLRRLVELEPDDEDRALALAECLLEQGDRGGAEHVLAAIRRRLTEELGVSPGRRWNELQERLK